MTLTDRTITGLRHVHDHLADVVGSLTEEQLGAQSGAEEWTVATTLSHMGSGSEINRYVLLRAIGEDVDAPDNQDVWDRWNALPPAGQAAGFVQHSDAIVATLEGLTEEQRIGTMVDLGFMPQPVPLGTVLGMRINEIALHGWDVEVALDPGAQALRGGGRPGRRALRQHDGVPARLHGQARAGADPARDRRLHARRGRPGHPDRRGGHRPERHVRRSGRVGRPAARRPARARAHARRASR